MIRDKLPKNWIHVYDGLRFETKTTLGRWSQSLKPPKVVSPYLHIGCGDRLLEGFLNTDVFTNKKAECGVDLRFNLPFPDSSFQGIYAHHVVEHIGYEDAKFFFQEALRVLQPKGILRVVVPDVGKFLEAYVKNPESSSELASFLPPWHRSPKWKTSLQVVDYVVRDTYFNPHRSTWDFCTLKGELFESGFQEVKLMECGISTDEKMNNLDNESWKDHSIYLEGFK